MIYNKESCDLLKNSYLCRVNNIYIQMIEGKERVVIC